MKLKKILHSLTSFVTIFALTSGIIITYSPAGAEDLTVDDIKDRIEQIKQDNEPGTGYDGKSILQIRRIPV